MGSHTVSSMLEAVVARWQGANLHFGHGTDSMWDEAVALVLEVAGLPDDEAYLHAALDPASVSRIQSIAERRMTERVPLAHLLGHCTFMGHRFETPPGVIVPRSPIGYLLEDGLQPWLPNEVRRIADLCCGSGCLGILAGHLYPEAELVLVDDEPSAIEACKRNVAAHGMSQRAQCHLGDVTEMAGAGEPFDLLVTNPPYVNARDMRGLPAEYRAEPEHALAAGEDGLTIIAPILERLPAWLAPEGMLVGEVGFSAPALRRRFPRLPFIWLDLPLGGEGVFVLEGRAATSHTARGA